jgi:SAM-dependent methyltransferase
VGTRTEIHFLRRGAFGRVVGIDCSPRVLAVAQRAAVGLSLSLLCADANAVVADRGGYDLAFSWMAMHYIADLGHVYGELAERLRPGGLLVLNEYVEGAHFRCDREHSSLMESRLQRLPQELRCDVNGMVRTQATPCPEHVAKQDPSKAVRADEIMPRLEERFRVLDRRDYGGGLLQFVLSGSAHRLREGNPEHMEWLARLYRAEQEGMAAGTVPNHYLVHCRRGSVEEALSYVGTC